MDIVRLVDQAHDDAESHREQFALDVLTGLCAAPKRIPTKYFYDDVGSELFQQITRHDDYYLTRSEYDILNTARDELPELIGDSDVDIIELGAGDGHKSQLIVDGFLRAGRRVNFYPIDISEKAMSLLEASMPTHANLTAHGVISEYFEGLRYVGQRSSNRQLVLFLGSNIGNFDRVQNQAFLRKLWQSVNAGDYLLIGFDMKKDVGQLTAAYNDSSGLTRAFNLNLLSRINRELSGTFDIEKFQHFGVYNPILGAMESYLLAVEAQDVYIGELQREFHFDPFEAIHLEYSFKFLRQDIEFIGQQTGFEMVRHFDDAKTRFIDSLWTVVKSTAP